MKVIERPSPVIAATVFDCWLDSLDRVFADAAADDFSAMFAPDGHWRDMLSFTWAFRTFEGRTEIRDGFAAHVPGSGAGRFRRAEGRAAPTALRRSGRDLIEGYFSFETAVGTGAGFVRLLALDRQGEAPRIWQLLTTLHELRGGRERTAGNRPSGDKYSKLHSSENWRQQREKEQAFLDRDPQVLIVGAGQGGLILAARLRQMGVDALVVEQTERVGDVWRNRYSNLTLHNEITANHFPYLPFPTTWPVWLPKDMMADWLESYANFLELNVWVATQLVSSRFDACCGAWTVTLRRADGTERVMQPKHLVAAMGVSGGVPRKVSLPGLANFAGTVMHSSEFRSGADWAGKQALVIGTGNSGHDIAQDLHVGGAAEVKLMQRGPTCVISLEPSAAISYAIYREDRSVDDVDLMTAIISYPNLIDTYQWITKKTNAIDKALLDGLNAAGFKTYTGIDETGFQLLYLRGAGGYYIDVGCSQLIVDGRIGVVQAEDMARFEAGGLRMKNGALVPLDLVVLATGFESMQEGIRRLVGDEVADKVGPVWGFDDDHTMRNMWKRTAQENFWIMGGAIIEARLFSRLLALQIKASLDGILPRAEPALPV